MNPILDEPEDDTILRRCRTCGEDKPITDFYTKYKKAANNGRYKFIEKDCNVMCE